MSGVVAIINVHFLGVQKADTRNAPKQVLTFDTLGSGADDQERAPASGLPRRSAPLGKPGLENLLQFGKTLSLSLCGARSSPRRRVRAPAWLQNLLPVFLLAGDGLRGIEPLFQAEPDSGSLKRRMRAPSCRSLPAPRQPDIAVSSCLPATQSPFALSTCSSVLSAHPLGHPGKAGLHFAGLQNS